MDRYYVCSMNKQNIVECMSIRIDEVVNANPNTLYNVYGELPRCLDVFFFMRKFGLPVKIVQQSRP